jgi:hypothetical protein
MNKPFAVAAGFIIGIPMLIGVAPALAHGTAQWSVTVGAPIYSPPPVVVYPQSQYIYGAPPSVIYTPPPVLYVQPQPVYQETWPAVRYEESYHHDHQAWREREWRERESREHEWRERQHQQRSEPNRLQRPTWGYEGVRR